MIGRSPSHLPGRGSCRWALLGAAVSALFACGLGCSSGTGTTPTGTFTTYTTAFSAKANYNLDILFMIDNSSGMSAVQQKLLEQIPTFMQTLQALPMGLPSVHVAVVSSDMGAMSDQGAALGCSQNGGDNGVFQVMPRGLCASNDFTVATDTYITDNASGSEKNFSLADPMGISTVLQCIALLGGSGCGFEHQLASIDRALGADSYPNPPNPPGPNVGFLRDGAYLAIIILTNEDDCSAPSNTTLFSLNGGQQDLTNPLGPISNYRCNRYGHLCEDPNGPSPTTPEQPPLNPPSDATGAVGAQTLTLDNCQSNDTDSGMLIPVSQFISDIKALKPDPDRQIFVAAITGPTTPYTVQWVPPNITPPESWPEVEHSCGPTGDGSSADPAIRITQFVNGFHNGVVTSICDDTYQAAMSGIAAGIGGMMTASGSPCLNVRPHQNALGHPDCSITNEGTNAGQTKAIVVSDCLENGGAAPCWTLAPDATTCPDGGLALKVSPDPANPSVDEVIVSCEVCRPGVATPGC
jgi:hypothetical protein